MSKPPATPKRSFRNANERFAEAVQGMKQMAAEMQRELEVNAR